MDAERSVSDMLAARLSGLLRVDRAEVIENDDTTLNLSSKILKLTMNAVSTISQMEEDSIAIWNYAKNSWDQAKALMDNHGFISTFAQLDIAMLFYTAASDRTTTVSEDAATKQLPDLLLNWQEMHEVGSESMEEFGMNAVTTYTRPEDIPQRFVRDDKPAVRKGILSGIGRQAKSGRPLNQDNLKRADSPFAEELLEKITRQEIWERIQMLKLVASGDFSQMLEIYGSTAASKSTKGLVAMAKSMLPQSDYSVDENLLLEMVGTRYYAPMLGDMAQIMQDLSQSGIPENGELAGILIQQLLRLKIANQPHAEAYRLVQGLFDRAITGQVGGDQHEGNLLSVREIYQGNGELRGLNYLREQSSTLRSQAGERLVAYLTSKNFNRYTISVVSKLLDNISSLSHWDSAKIYGGLNAGLVRGSINVANLQTEKDLSPVAALLHMLATGLTLPGRNVRKVIISRLDEVVDAWNVYWSRDLDKRNKPHRLQKNGSIVFRKLEGYKEPELTLTRENRVNQLPDILNANELDQQVAMWLKKQKITDLVDGINLPAEIAGLSAGQFLLQKYPAGNDLSIAGGFDINTVYKAGEILTLFEEGINLLQAKIKKLGNVHGFLPYLESIQFNLAGHPFLTPRKSSTFSNYNFKPNSADGPVARVTSSINKEISKTLPASLLFMAQREISPDAKSIIGARFQGRIYNFFLQESSWYAQGSRHNNRRGEMYYRPVPGTIVFAIPTGQLTTIGSNENIRFILQHSLVVGISPGYFI